MPLTHTYTRSSLPADDPRFLPRTPGAADIARLFPSPSSSGRGRLSIEGGVSVVAGPGMGKTSLLAHLAEHLDRDRALATAFVSLPPGSSYPGEDGFYAFLGHFVRSLRAGLMASSRIQDASFAPVARALVDEPAWDAPGTQPGMSPRGVERWIASLAAAAVQTHGVCLLIDDVDNVTSASWKSAFVAGLRFTFQTSSGITPVYALWSLFADEALAGSNYFRNVTRPFFLEPLSTNERRALVDLALPTLPDATAARLFRLVGGHPQLLHQALADLCTALPSVEAVAKLKPADLDVLFSGPVLDAQRALTRDLLARTPTLGVALREIARGAHGARALAKGLLATGLVDRDVNGRAVLPLRVTEVL